ncbi:hypothetical protein F5B19DRAFT_61731 [Rostrohypoxylon terebratum]|nr:hypothetical protein F5B19DRAFT_61731 [Rostrohypoxylon terebratum]
MNYTKLIQEGAAKAAKWVAENPKNTAAYSAAGVALLVPGIIAAPALAAAGFGAAGPIAGTFTYFSTRRLPNSNITNTSYHAGSIAAGAQASAGNIAAGSLFATLQSAGMAGYGAAIVNGVIQAGGAVAAATTAGRAAMQATVRKNPRKSDLILVENTWAALNSEMQQSFGKCDAPINDLTNLTEVKEAVEKFWECVSTDMINELGETVPQQLEAYEKNVGETDF